MTRILIADDHQMFIDGIKSLLKPAKQIQVVGEAGNGTRLLELLAGTPADLVLMDVNMPEMDGIEATRLVRAQYPDVKILMLTMFNSRDYIEKLLRAGAHGYILKNTGKEELLLAIESN
jgi:DNA-binding NarL/FixJ family response regulator